MSSEVVDFRVYYRECEITMTESSADLRGFAYFDTKVRQPLQFSKVLVLAWLHQEFGVDPSAKHFKISILISRTRNNVHQ